jgi:mannitol/fructose-specific phosphotransferase system IIA component (Ntr-type)
MKIMDFLNQDNIILDVQSQNKTAVLIELIQLIQHDSNITNDIVNIILEREQLGSTGMVYGKELQFHMLKQILSNNK